MPLSRPMSRTSVSGASNDLTYAYQVVGKEAVIEVGEGMSGIEVAVLEAAREGGAIIERVEWGIGEGGKIMERGVPVAMSIGRSGFWIHVGACRPLEALAILRASLCLIEQGVLACGTTTMDREARDTLYTLDLDLPDTG